MALESSTPAIEHVPVALPDSQSPGTKVPEVNGLTSTPETNAPEDKAEPTPAAALAPGIAPAPPRYRLRFRKAGDLRSVSHHDLMHVFERLFRRCRRSDSLFTRIQSSSQAFVRPIPGPGIVGENEVMEMIFKRRCARGTQRSIESLFTPGNRDPFREGNPASSVGSGSACLFSPRHSESIRHRSRRSPDDGDCPSAKRFRSSWRPRVMSSFGKGPISESSTFGLTCKK